MVSDTRWKMVKLPRHISIRYLCNAKKKWWMWRVVYDEHFSSNVKPSNGKVAGNRPNDQFWNDAYSWMSLFTREKRDGSFLMWCIYFRIVWHNNKMFVCLFDELCCLSACRHVRLSVSGSSLFGVHLIHPGHLLYTSLFHSFDTLLRPSSYSTAIEK